MSRKLAALPMATKEDREMASTKDVVDHHLKCFGERDLKGILFDYTPGAVLFTPDGPLRGAAEGEGVLVKVQNDRARARSPFHR